MAASENDAVTMTAANPDRDDILLVLGFKKHDTNKKHSMAIQVHLELIRRHLGFLDLLKPADSCLFSFLCQFVACAEPLPFRCTLCNHMDLQGYLL